MPKRIVAFAVAAVVTLMGAGAAVVAGFVIANASVLDTGDNSVYDNYQIKYIGTVGNDPATARSVISADGTINGTVMSDLAVALTRAGEGTKRGTYTEWNAGDFSDSVIPVGQRHVQSAALLVKLFPDEYANELSRQWFQIVYRSTDSAGDVLTLYAVQPYRTGIFHQSEGTYSSSVIRADIKSDFDKLNAVFEKDLSQYFVPASLLPGQWQNTATQTDSDFSANNGMDGLDDVIFIPSAFETTYMGRAQENARGNVGFETYVTDYGFADSGLGTTSHDENEFADTRHGLWRLNGYDRAFTDDLSGGAWLRSGGAIDRTGQGTVRQASVSAGVRPAFNFNMSEVAVYTDPIAPYTGKGTVDKTELHFYMQLLPRILDGTNTDYIVTDTAGASALVTLMGYAFADNNDPTYIDALVTKAKLLININTEKFCAYIDTVTDAVDAVDTRFTGATLTAYQTQLDLFRAQLEQIYANAEFLTVVQEELAAATAQAAILETLWTTAKTQRDKHRSDFNACAAEMLELEAQLAVASESQRPFLEALWQMAKDAQAISNANYVASAQAVYSLELQLNDTLKYADELSEMLSDGTSTELAVTVARLYGTLFAIYDAQEALTVYTPPTLGALDIGVIVALGILLVGVVILNAVSLRPKRK